MRTKAQVQSQVFVYIISVMIAGMLLLFGYRAVDKFTEDASFAEELQFQNNLRKLFNGIDYRSEVVEDLILPDKYGEVCFLRLQKDGTSLYPSGAPIMLSGKQDGLTQEDMAVNDPVMDSFRLSNTGKSAFLRDKGTGLITSSLDVGPTILYDGPNNICFKAANRKVTLRLFGCGKSGVLIAGIDDEPKRTNCND